MKLSRPDTSIAWVPARGRRAVHSMPCILVISIFLAAGISAVAARAQQSPDLASAPPDALLKIYAQLRSLHGGDQGAVAENVVWKRDAATFTLIDGRITFAAPVAGRVLAAVFDGRGTFELSPPTPLDQHQIARFTKGGRFVERFNGAVFFFTDDSAAELQKLVYLRPGANADAATKVIQSAQKKYSEDFNDWVDNQTKGNPIMRNMAARMLADLSDPSSRGFFLADFKAEHEGNLLYQITWNRDSLLLPMFANDEEVMLLHVDLGKYFEWLAGFHLAAEYARTPHPEHRTLVLHCPEEKIDAEIGKDRRLTATADMDVEAPNGAVRLLPLNLQGVLRIDSVQDGTGQKLAFIQEDRKLDNDPWVILPAPAVAGHVYKLRISYQEDSSYNSHIIYQQGDGLYFVGARESWYPSFGAFDDRTHFVMHIRSPKRYTLVATGHLTHSEKKGNDLETDWESEIPYPVVGFNYGDFVEKSVTDPKLTVTAYNGRQIPDELKGVNAALDMAQLAQGVNGVDMDSRYGIMRGGFNTAASAKFAAGVSYQALKLYAAYYGELPFQTVSVTEQPVRGFGQSWPTLIFLPYDSLLDATTRNSLNIQASAEAREFYDVVAVHEMSHQWWGHLVGWKTYHDQWLSEGFADFSAALYLRKFEPKKWNSFWELKRKWLLDKNPAGNRPVDVGPLWLNSQLSSYLEPRNTQILIYYKGAYVLEMLRALMEDPRSANPDGKFIDMMHDFVSTYASKNASTQDFKRIVEKHFKESMDWFFNEWVYGTETPHYDLSYELTDGAKGQTILHLAITQSEVSDSFYMRVPLYVTLQGNSRRLGFITLKGSSSFNQDIPLPFRPEKVSLDDTRSILCTVKQ